MVPRLLRVHPKTRDRLDRERREAERDGAYRVAKRIHAVLLNTQGHTSGRIAGILGAPRSRVADWLATYESYGLDGLLEGQRSGRPRQLDDQQRVALADIIDSGPVAYGLVGVAINTVTYFLHRSPMVRSPPVAWGGGDAERMPVPDRIVRR
jgi:transposase